MGQKRNGVEENININQECNSKSFKVITLTKHAEESYGFSIIFNENLSQYIVKCVREGSIGQKCGIKTGDVICEINDNLIENLNLQDILLILKNSKTFLTLAVFDPSFQGDIRSTNKCNTQSPRIKNSSLDKSKMKREKSNRDSKKFCLLRRLSINSNKREKLKKRNSSGNSTELSDYNFCARKYLMDDSNTSSDKNSRHSSIIFKKKPNESNQDSTPSNNPVTDQSELIPDPCCHACKHQCGREVKNSSPDSPNNSKNKYLIYGHKMKNYPLQDISYNSFREDTVITLNQNPLINHNISKYVLNESEKKKSKKTKTPFFDIMGFMKNIKPSKISASLNKYKTTLSPLERVEIFKNL